MSQKFLYKEMDMMLGIIASKEYILKDNIYIKSAPNDLQIVLDALISEEMIEEKNSYFCITQKGRIMISEGGYMSIYRRKRKENIAWTCGIISTAVSIIALILSFL